MQDASPLTPILEVQDVRVRFAERQALNGISLSLWAGEILVLLGPNGAGKSTLVRVISGRLEPQSGRAMIDRRNPAVDARARLLLGIVPQRIALFEKLSALENLRAFGRLMGLSGRACAKAAEQALDRVGLADRGCDCVSDLSGGMRRRVNIAAALLHAPRVLVLDEPTAGLDYKSQAGLIHLLRELRGDGLAILLTTHDMGEAEALADRVAVLAAGEVRVEGTIHTLLSDVFGRRRELTLRLHAGAVSRAGARVAEALAAAGLVLEADGCSWTGIVDAGDHAIENLMDTAIAADAVIDDVRIGRPGLEALLRRFVDGEASR